MKDEHRSTGMDVWIPRIDRVSRCSGAGGERPGRRDDDSINQGWVRASRSTGRVAAPRTRRAEQRQQKWEVGRASADVMVRRWLSTYGIVMMMMMMMPITMMMRERWFGERRAVSHVVSCALGC